MGNVYSINTQQIRDTLQCNNSRS